MTTNAGANPPSAIEDGQPKRASFMGLPPELRLRIYGFLFSGDWAKEEKEKSDEEDLKAPEETAVVKDDGEGQDDEVRPDGLQSLREDGREQDHVDTTKQCVGGEGLQHCCSIPGGFQYEDDWEEEATSLPLICPCFGRLYPALLSTSKLIYIEAMPIFYRNLEVRIALPRVTVPEELNTCLNSLLEALPHSALQYISKAMLCQSTAKLGITVDNQDEPNLGDFNPIWTKLTTEMPNIKHVRIHLDLDFDISMSHFDFQQFAGIGRLPSLRTVDMDLFCSVLRGSYDGKYINKSGDTMEGFRGRLAATIKDEAQKLGRCVAITGN